MSSPLTWSICGRLPILQGVFHYCPGYLYLSVSGGVAELVNGGLGLCGLVQVSEAVPEVFHHCDRVCRDAFVDGNSELYGAGVAENAHANADVAALRYPEHGLNQFAAG